MSKMNRLANAKNKYQGEFKRVLCVCSAGVLRSPTAAMVLSKEPFHFNTRAAGIESDFALVIVDEILLHWADEVVCMTEEQAHKLKNDHGYEGKIVCLGIQDDFEYRDPQLIKLITEKYTELTK